MKEEQEGNGLMQVKCAWCGKHLGRKHHHEPAVSHGICYKCAHKIRVELLDDELTEKER